MQTLRSLFVLTGLALTAAPPAALAATAADNYEKHCASCHGADGKAKTRLGRKSGALDLSEKERMAKMSDLDAFNTIKNGRRNKKGEEVMDSFKKELSDQEVIELVAYVRRFSR